VPGLTAFDIELAVETLKKTQITCIDHIPKYFIKAGGRTIRSEIHKLINSIWNKEETPKEWKESTTVNH